MLENMIHYYSSCSLLSEHKRYYSCYLFKILDCDKHHASFDVPLNFVLAQSAFSCFIKLELEPSNKD
jgi:hypothetical protein